MKNSKPGLKIEFIPGEFTKKQIELCYRLILQAIREEKDKHDRNLCTGEHRRTGGERIQPS